MEKLLHYCWKHRILPYASMFTTDGAPVEVIDPGLQNYDAGPDFFNAKIRINGTLWVGNVEIHTHRRDWYSHGHDRDGAYDNVILHVINRAERVGESLPANEQQKKYATTSSGRIIPEMEIDIPEEIVSNFCELLHTDSYPPCYRVIPTLPHIMVHSWMAALQTERLQQKTEEIIRTLRMLGGDWEHTFFISLSRSFGFGHNTDAMEIWARDMPLLNVAHHRDNLLQVEAFFFGQAGMLRLDSFRENRRLEVSSDTYFSQLCMEYKYLSHKFSLSEPASLPWHLLRMRPQNFPFVRIAQLSKLYHERHTSLSQFLECDSVEDIYRLLSCGVSEYWEKHYVFGKESKHNAKHLSHTNASLVVINCVIPMLFAYGRHSGSDALCDKALSFLDSIKAEDNNITRLWKNVGLDIATAGDSQALIQLKKMYCDRKDCLRCRIGYEFLKKTKK